MRHRSAVVGVTFLIAGLAACGGARPSRYYQLEVPPMSAVASGTGQVYPVDLLVGRMSASHLYREDRIVYETGGQQMGTYEYQRWAEPPTEMLEALLVRALRTSGRFRSVQTLRSTARGDYTLRGRLHQFEEVSGGPLVARVAFELELDEVKSGTAVWTTYYSQDEPVNGKDVPAVVAALNRNVQRGLQQVVADLDQYFAAHPPK